VWTGLDFFQISAARRMMVGYRIRLDDAGRGPFHGGSTPSSGYVALYVMLQLCDQVGVVNIFYCTKLRANGRAVYIPYSLPHYARYLPPDRGRIGFHYWLPTRDAGLFASSNSAHSTPRLFREST